jgi:hypothetical protein
LKFRELREGKPEYLHDEMSDIPTAMLPMAGLTDFDSLATWKSQIGEQLQGWDGSNVWYRTVAYLHTL